MRNQCLLLSLVLSEGLLQIFAQSGSADISLSGTSAPASVQPDNNVTYKIVVTNSGPSSATGVRVVDQAPQGATFVSAISTQGVCTQTGSPSRAEIDCNVGNLSNGASASITLVVTAAEAGSMVNTATGAAGEPDPNIKNNSASTGTTVAPKLYFAQVADGGGYTTTFALLNSNGSDSSGILRFFTSGGGARRISINGIVNSEFNLSIPARGAVSLSTDNVGPAVSGWASFESADPIQGVATFDLRNRAGVLMTTAGVVGGYAVRRAATPVQVNATTDTGVAIAYPGQFPLNVRLRLLDAAGAEVGGGADGGVTSLSRHSQIVDFVTNLFPSIRTLDNLRGTLLVEVPGTSGAVAVTGLIVKDGLLSALPVVEIKPPLVFFDLGQVLGSLDLGQSITGFGAADPTVALLPDGRIRLYSEGSGTLASAVSTDGITFRAETGLTLSSNAHHPRVVARPEGGWRAFFVDNHCSISQGGPGCGIKSAISSDGLTFTPEPGVRISADMTGTPDFYDAVVVTLADGRYRLYFGGPYTDDNSVPRWIRSAISSNMLSWTVEPGVRIGPGAPTLKDSAEHASALSNPDGSITLVYGRRSPGLFGLFMATSKDGLNFDSEWFTGIPAALDSELVRRPDGSILLYYGNHIVVSNSNTIRVARVIPNLQ